jgi:hypothetical protein
LCATPPLPRHKRDGDVATPRHPHSLAANARRRLPDATPSPSPSCALTLALLHLVCHTIPSLATNARRCDDVATPRHHFSLAATTWQRCDTCHRLYILFFVLFLLANYFSRFLATNLLQARGSFCGCERVIYSISYILHVVL